MSKRIIKISPSSLSTLEDCARKYDYSKIRRLFPKDRLVDTYANAKERGTLIHSLLANYYELKKTGRLNGETVTDLIQNARANTLIDTELPSEVIEKSIRIFAEYVLHYKSETWVVIAIEQAFSRILYEDADITIISEGIIDLVVNTAGKTNVPVDHKSVERNESPNSLTNQFINYAWALDSGLLIENRIGMQKTLPVDEKLTRHIHSYPHDVIEEWKESVIYHVKKMDQYVQAEYFPPSYAKCYNCYYKELCGSDKATRELKILNEWKAEEGSRIYNKMIVESVEEVASE